jgi:hypothetical protein
MVSNFEEFFFNHYYTRDILMDFLIACDHLDKKI